MEMNTDLEVQVLRDENDKVTGYEVTAWGDYGEEYYGRYSVKIPQIGNVPPGYDEKAAISYVYGFAKLVCGLEGRGENRGKAASFEKQKR